MTEHYDVIVIGGGAMGTATARNLAMSGRRTLVLERFTSSQGHANGSSGGPTRIFRLAYHTPAYVRFAMRALDAWLELQDAGGEQLLKTTGGLDVGDGGRETAAALELAGATVQYLSADAVTERWPALSFPGHAEIFLQPDGGVVRAARTVEVQTRLAVAAGADLREGVRASSISESTGGVEVHTGTEEVFSAPVVVVAAGPWAGPLLRTAGIDLPLVPSFEQVTYFQLEDAEVAAPGGLPTVIDWMPDRVQTPYLVPDPFDPEPGHYKIGLHLSGPPADPDTRTFDPDPARIERVRNYVGDHVAGSRDLDRTDTCLYTNTPDEDFVLDRIGPIVVASPCSGHGFKFVPLVGEIVAALAMGEEPPASVPLFRADRPALRG
jgi:sarcosine oxidase